MRGLLLGEERNGGGEERWVLVLDDERSNSGNPAVVRFYANTFAII